MLNTRTLEDMGTRSLAGRGGIARDAARKRYNEGGRRRGGSPNEVLYHRQRGAIVVGVNFHPFHVLE